MIVRTSKGSGISGAVRYVMGEGKLDPETGKAPELQPGEKSRVAWYGGMGFGFPIDDEKRLDIARRVMEWAAVTQSSKTRKCTQDCFHLMLAWDKDEHPPRSEMEAAAQSVLAHLGMENARAIWVCHDDTEHMHLHIVASRIDPESGKAFRDSFDKTKLSEWALAWELEHGGVRCEARVEKQKKEAERDPEKIVNAFAARRETFTERDLMRELGRAIPSRETRRAYVEGVLARRDIVELADPETGAVKRYTTRPTLAAEHLAEASAARLFAEDRHRVSGRSLHGVLEELKAEGKVLRRDQMLALEHATGPEGLSVISGKAGTGKSFTMGAIANAYQAEGYEVTTLAPTNKVASALKRDGLEAGTLHSALGRLDRGQLAWDGRTVVMVDESGMISTRLMARLLSHAENAGAKVILVGDEKQLASMERGGLFGHFAAEHGEAELSEITRQRGPEQRELAMRASRYDFRAGLAALEREGGLVTVDRAEERIPRAAQIWGERTAAHPERSMFVVAVSNKDAEAANLAIRGIRRERGELGPDREFATPEGTKSFAVGDRVLFSGTAASREERSAGLVNGHGGVIKAIEGSRMTLLLEGAKAGDEVTFTVGKNREAGEFDALRLGYAGTIYKAQGATYDEAIVIDSPTMRASAGYVALTRHRDSVTVIAARESEATPESWMAGKGGLDGLPAEQRESAERSYNAWREAHPKPGARHGFADYVGYVQTREAERRGQDFIADMAKRWGRVDDRRAASRFEPLNYEPPDVSRVLSAEEVRAIVGVERFEEGAEPLVPITADATALRKAKEQVFDRTEARREEREGSAGRSSGREAEAGSASSGSGSNASGGGESGSSGSGGTDTVAKSRWSWPSHGGDSHQLEAMRQLDAQNRQPVAPPRAAVGSVPAKPSAATGRAFGGSSGWSAGKAREASAPGETSAQKAASGNSGTANAWRALRMPKRPQNVKDERAMLAAIAKPVVAHVHEHEEPHKDTGGASWWRRTTMEASELWHSARDWVQTRWSQPSRGPDGAPPLHQPHEPEPKGPGFKAGPEVER